MEVITQMVKGFSLATVCLLSIACLLGGCCFPGDTAVLSKIDGIIVDKNDSPIAGQSVVFIGYNADPDSLATNNQGRFSAEVFNSDPVAVCFIPPTALFMRAREPYFTISFPDLSTRQYKIEFPWGKLKYSVLDIESNAELPSDQQPELEIHAVLEDASGQPDYYRWRVDLKVVVHETD